MNEGEDVPLSSSSLVGQMRVFVPMKGLIDPTAELKRLGKRLEKLQAQAGGIERKLANEGFTSKAPADVVQGERDKLAELQGQIEVMEGQMKELEGL